MEVPINLVYCVIRTGNLLCYGLENLIRLESLCGITASLLYRSQCSARHKFRLLWNSYVGPRSHLGVNLLQALESS